MNALRTFLILSAASKKQMFLFMLYFEHEQESGIRKDIRPYGWK